MTFRTKCIGSDTAGRRSQLRLRSEAIAAAHKWLTVACSLMITSVSSYGQKAESPTITAEFVNTTAAEFISVLEKQSGFRFYYDPATIDSVKITLSIKDQPLAKVLALAFDGIAVFSIDKQSNV